MNYRWVQRKVEDEGVIVRLARELNSLPEALARTLVVRGIDTFDQAREFFRPSLDLLHDPFLMAGMKPAAQRLAKAVRDGERVLVYGDYDVDGTTAVSLMLSFLRDMGLDAAYFIPDRFKDGYGLSPSGIDNAVSLDIGLAVALDCGITGYEAATHARQKGVDLIICDHHTPGETLPDAVGVLDPKRPDCRYPFKELTGCGVGYKLVEATLSELSLPQERATAYLDFVALSIASDIVPIVGENRALMVEGLRHIREQPRLGLEVLAQEANISLSECDTSQIVFAIGPRINAAGRLDDACLAVELLTAQDADRAKTLARQLETLNGQRRRLDQKTLDEALELVARSAATCMEHALVLHNPEWHVGVIGIVASRLVERFYKPTIMLASQNGEAKGSARSIANLNIYEVLRSCSHLLSQFGGHMYAAGVSLPEENVDEFRECLNQVVRSMVTPDLMCPEIVYDSGLELSDVTPKFWRILQQFGPFGPENKNPVFHSRGLQVVSFPSIVGDGHLKFRVRQSNGSSSRPIDVIGFRMHEHLPVVRTCRTRKEPIEMLFSIDENRFQGQNTLQLKLKDLRAEASEQGEGSQE